MNNSFYSIPTDLPASIFRAYDIRGIVGQTLTENVVYAIGRAIGSEAKARGEQQVIVARDGRLSGPFLSQALLIGLLESGRDVIDIGEVPTPILYFATHALAANSGVMLTGSHNPPNYNGLKIVLGGETLSNESIFNLYRWITDGHMASGRGRLEKMDLLDAYLAAVAKDVQLLRPLKVVVDCGNGVAGHVAPLLYERLGCQVIPLYCDVDGRFPNHHPDPSDPANLQALIEKVRATNADVGLAFDGDGDRLGVVTNKGTIVLPDRQLMLYAQMVLLQFPGSQIIYDVKCTNHLKDVIEKAGGKPLMWKTGHSFIKAKLKETKAALAGEMSGHTFFNDRWFGFDDALYTGARLLEIISCESRDAETIFAALPDSINTPELKLAVSEDRKFELMQQIIQSAIFPDAQLTTIDGLRIDFEDGWGLVRPSNTTPYLILRFEADNEIALKRIQEQFRAQLLAVDAQLELPF